MSAAGSPVAEDAMMREEKEIAPSLQAGNSVEDAEDEDAGPSVPRRKMPRSSSEEDDKQMSDDGKGDDDEDDLFGGDDNDSDDDDDEQAMRRPNRTQRRQVGSQSPQPTSRQAANQQDSASVSDEEMDEASRRRREELELRETSAEPPMGYRDGGGVQADEREAKEATFAIPSLPVRRDAHHFYARLPNLLQYRAEHFDQQTFDAQAEDEALQNREGIRIDDAGLRSLLTTSNTVRWRWSEKRDADGVRKPESNARFVRWNDGSLSLQLGSEFYDITTSSERAQHAPSSTSASAADTTTAASLVPPQPIQHLTHLFVKHDGQDSLNVYQAEAPIVGSMTLRPTSITSESHQRLAKAVRQQRGILVKETVTKEDPELEKERLEREEKKRKQLRAREAKKRRPQDDDDDDAFWASAGRAVRRGTGTAAGKRVPVGVANAYDDEDDDDADGTGALLETVGDEEDDGFVVDDEEDEEGESSSGRRGGRGNRDIDMDDEPDEIDKLEAEMERQEARRLANKADRSHGDAAAVKASNGVDYSEAEDEEEEAATAARRKRVVEESDDE